jgi:hypothetical protein
MNVGKFGPYLKAIVSALVSGIIAFLSSLLTALQGEHTGFDTITAGQWVTAAPQRWRSSSAWGSTVASLTRCAIGPHRRRLTIRTTHPRSLPPSHEGLIAGCHADRHPPTVPIARTRSLHQRPEGGGTRPRLAVAISPGHS